MEPNQLAGLLGQGGATAALIWIIYRVGLKLVAAVDALRSELASHTKQDLAAQGEVREEIIALGSRLDVALDLTPIRGVKQRAASEPGTRGFYGPRKPPREDG